MGPILSAVLLILPSPTISTCLILIFNLLIKYNISFKNILFKDLLLILLNLIV